MTAAGVCSYEELDVRLQKAHERVLRSQGQVAFGEMLARLPLSPCDDAVETIARELGWDDSFMTQSRANLPIATTRLRPPLNNRQVPEMFGAVASQSKAPPPRRPAGVAAPGAGIEAQPVVAPRAAAPLRVVPGPRAPPPNAAAARPAAAAMPEAPVPVPLPAPVAAEAPEEIAGGVVQEVVAPEDRPICAICQDFMDGPESGEVEAFPCGHAFHSICIAQWKRAANLVGAIRCPTCRRPVPADNGNDEWDMGQDLPAGDGNANGPAAAEDNPNNNAINNVDLAQEVVA